MRALEETRAPPAAPSTVETPAIAADARRTRAGEGTRTPTPRKGTPDFKSGASRQFRHPGDANASGLQPRPVVRRRDLLRRRPDCEDDLLVRLQLVREGAPGLLLAVDVPLVALAVRPDALVVQEYAPLREEIAERVVLVLRRLDVDDPVGGVRVQLRDVRGVVDPDELRHGQLLAVQEDVEMLVDVVRELLGRVRVELE